VSAETVAERYARAIFDLGIETSTLSGLVEDMHKLADVYAESTELQKIMSNPLIPETERLATIGEIADRIELSPLAKNTAGLLAQRKRMFALPAIAAELDRLSDEKAGIARATVISAERLSEAYELRLTQELSVMTGKKIVLESKQDPALLAGLIVRIGDQVIDGSARARIAELSSQLLSA
jgi:F-type H+-transporting ATPase subunit delta